MISRFTLSLLAFLAGIVASCAWAEGTNCTWSHASSQLLDEKPPETHPLPNPTALPESLGSALAIETIPIFGTNIGSVNYQGDPTLAASVSDSRSAYANNDGLSLDLSARPGTAGNPPSRATAESVASEGSSVSREMELEPEFPHSFIFVTWRFFTASPPDSAQDARPSTFAIDVEDHETHRNLVSISSRDDRMFPISQALAAGTGFDIYESREETSSSQQELTLPAASMTGMRTTGFLIDGTDKARVRFNINHGNNHPRGSMAMIDRIEFTSMLPPQLHRGGSDCVTFQENCANLFPAPGSFFDPDFPERPPRFCELQPEDEGQSPDLHKPQEFRGTVMATVIADGETRIPLGGLIGGKPREEFEISFLEGNAPEDGGFGEFGSFDRLPSVTVPTFPHQGSTVGLAQFRVPDTFVSESLDLETEFGPSRQVRVRFCFQNPGGKDRVCTTPPAVEIRRPPVVLMHGLWSDSATWNQFDLGNSEIVDAHIADYSASNASSFSENRDVPANMLLRHCAQHQSQGWFFTQADVIGHSMGGLLARDYMAKAAPFTTINRLYTLNTPHTGSPLANFLISIRSSTLGDRFTDRMNRIRRPIDQGAIDDLATDSAALASLPTTRVLSHALVGVGGSQFDGSTLIQAPGLIGDIFRLADRFVDLDDLFQDMQHDLVVGRQSQIGGLPLGTYTVFDGLNSIHTRATSSTEYSEEILCPEDAAASNGACVRGSGLASSTGTREFAFFPAPGLAMANHQHTNEQLTNVDQQGKTQETVVIVAPSEGDTFESGESVTVEAEPVAPYVAESMLLMSEFSVVDMPGPPFTATLEIPIEFVGRFPISILAKDNEGVFGDSGDLELVVEAPAELISLSVEPNQMFLRGATNEQQIIVRGEFADGVTRHLKSSSTGTTYVSSDHSVVEVTSEGTVMPRGEGTATIVVENGDAMDSLTVEVLEFDIGEVFRDRFEDLANSFLITGLFWGASE